MVTAASKGSVAVAANSGGAVADAATSVGAGELCAAQIHKVATAIIGSADDGGRTSGTTRLGCAGSTVLETTGLGSTESTRLESPLDLEYRTLPPSSGLGPPHRTPVRVNETKETGTKIKRQKTGTMGTKHYKIKVHRTKPRCNRLTV